MATLEIDGKTCEAENGKMIIEVADDAGIYIPRFCYHKKLSVAANCRMCLVEVANNKKTVPACATPITEGMKVFTCSEAAVRSQKAVMEFLLINHPLDCPVCDQGGECDLQDLSLEYGSDRSTYDESKRAVENPRIGPLVATEMTRCIHCTRCVRFGDEVAGLRELGAVNRGEQMSITTYVEHSMRSELSGNIIDLCPVGALTSKPFRFKARAWEMIQGEGVAPHDCLGSQIYFHTLRNKVMRVVPRECERLNEIWLSDQDRFAYLGLDHPTRATRPWIKRQGHWEAVDWQTALTFATKKLTHVIQQHGAEQVAALTSSASSTEACYLLQKWMRGLGVRNLDYRLQQCDFRDQNHQTITHQNTLAYVELESQQTIVLVGCHVLKEVPLAAIRLRKAALNGGQLYAFSPFDGDQPFELTDRWILNMSEWVMQLATLLLAVVDEDASRLPVPMQKLVLGLTPDDRIRALATRLRETQSVFVMGAVALNCPEASLIRTLLAHIAQHSRAKILCFSPGANSQGAALAGMLPHRHVGGKLQENPGLHAKEAIEKSLKAYVLMGVEPEYDFANAKAAREAMLSAECVIALSHYDDPAIREYADVILPMSTYAESYGTFVNIDGDWQSMKGVIPSVGESRPAWKILRVLGHLTHATGFEYTSVEEVLAELKQHVEDTKESIETTVHYPEMMPTPVMEFHRIGTWPLYRGDTIVRRADALQACASRDTVCARMHPESAQKLRLENEVTLSQGEMDISLPLEMDERVAKDCIWVPCGLPETIDLGDAYGPITVRGQHVA